MSLLFSLVSTTSANVFVALRFIFVSLALCLPVSHRDYFLRTFQNQIRIVSEAFVEFFSLSLSHFSKEKRHVANKLHCFRKKRSLPNVIEIRINAKVGMHSNVHHNCVYRNELHTVRTGIHLKTKTERRSERVILLIWYWCFVWLWD